MIVIYFKCYACKTSMYAYAQVTVDINLVVLGIWLSCCVKCGINFCRSSVVVPHMKVQVSTICLLRVYLLYTCIDSEGLY